MQNVEYIGLAAGLITTIAFLPQIIQIFRTKSVKDISLMMYVTYSVGLIIWVTYGYIISSYAIMITNSITLMLALITVIMKLKLNVSDKLL